MTEMFSISCCLLETMIADNNILLCLKTTIHHTKELDCIIDLLDVEVPLWLDKAFKCHQDADHNQIEILLVCDGMSVEIDNYWGRCNLDLFQIVLINMYKQ